MSTLRSGIDEVGATDLRFLSDTEVVDLLHEVRSAASALVVQDARILAEVERRGVHANDGHLSVSSWVAAEFRTGYSEAARDVRVARALEDMPATRDALTEGEVSPVAVGILMSAKETNPEAFSTGWSITGSGSGWTTQGRCSPGRTGP